MDRDAILLPRQMARKIIRLSFLLLVVLVAQALATESLVGIWKLSSQTIDGHKVDNEPLVLRVYPVGDALEFAFSTPVNGIHLVSLKFTSVHLDGREANVEDVKGKKMGTVKVTKIAPQAYKAVIEGPNRPKAVATMTVSADNKTLTSESNTEAGGSGGSHVVQVFSRN